MSLNSFLWHVTVVTQFRVELTIVTDVLVLPNHLGIFIDFD